MSFDGDRKPRVFIDVQNLVEKHSVFSPDGRWLAYMSTSMFGTSNTEVFVQPFPSAGATYQISTDIGRTPLWSPDGKQLFYLGQTAGLSRVEGVDIRTQPSFAFSKPAPLPIDFLVQRGFRAYDITPDGKQFLVMLPPSETATGERGALQINVVLNWFRDLERRVPTK